MNGWYRFRGCCGEGRRQKSPQDTRHISWGEEPSERAAGWAGHGIALLVTLSPLHVPLPEQARMAAGQLMQWKGDEDQDGYLLLKSVYVLTETDSVSSRPHGP